MSEAVSARRRGFRAVSVAYVVAALSALVAGLMLGGREGLWIALGADVVATLVVYGFSMAYGNSSFYDAYWSVAPIALVAYWASDAPEGNGARQLLVFSLVVLWGLRLTYNWARGWPGLEHEDWRYVNMREASPGLYWLVSLFGIHLFPTAVVFLALIPAYSAVRSPEPLGVLDAVAAAVTLGAIAIETAADEQLRAFVGRGREPGEILDSGLWAWSRHPNYFGEMSFWWGLFLFAVAADVGVWALQLAGPMAITLMFFLASIPLLERRSLERRPGYAEHARRTSALVPWPPRRR